MLQHSLGHIAATIGAELIGDPEIMITGMATLQDARPTTLAFLDNSNYRKFLKTTSASAVILSRADAENCSVHCLVVAKPYLAYAKAAAMFDNTPQVPAGVHPSASVAPDAWIHPTAAIGPRAVIESGARIEQGAVISAGTVIGMNSVIGDFTFVGSNVVLYHDVRIGKRCRIHAGAVLGADGFGIANMGEQGWLRVPQIGGVLVGDDVDVGANTTIDRGAINDTIIGNGVKLDNQIQIGHNVVIGDHTAIAACTAIAGSAKIGRHCIIGGGAGIAGHLELADHVCLTAFTGVNTSITTPGVYSGGLLPDTTESWRKNAVRFRQLDKMARRITALEKRVQHDLGASEA